MTTTTSDIKDSVNLHCSSIHFLELDRLLEKLDNTDLDVLYYMLKETYEAGESEGIYRLEQKCQAALQKLRYSQEHYDEGYADGYDDGMDEG